MEKSTKLGHRKGVQILDHPDELGALKRGDATLEINTLFLYPKIDIYGKLGNSNTNMIWHDQF